MLINPSTHRLPVVEGTRIISLDLGLIGAEIVDPVTPAREWVVQGLYAPIPQRRLGGLRAKVRDQKGFTGFCNQRDLEVLLGLAQPDNWCEWAAHKYPAPGVEGWYGICMDSADLEDDLYDEELFLRAQNPGVLSGDLDIIRRIHIEQDRDAEDYWVLFRDINPETGLGPDVRQGTLYQRWNCVQRDWLPWTRI